MEIQADVTLPFPRERVYAAYRDRLTDLVEFLPNIKAIRQLEREERPGEVKILNEWTGGGDIPAALKAFIDESMLKWLDHATWREAASITDWRVEVKAFNDAIRSSGTNRFLEVPGGTKLEIRGDLTCDASRIPAVPRLAARMINGTVEKLFVGKIQVNLVEVAKGVGKLLEREGS